MAAMPIAVAAALKVLLIVPPVAPESFSRGSSRSGRHVQLLGHFPKGLHALRIVDVLAEADFVWADPGHFAVVEEIASANQVALVVGAADLRDVAGTHPPDPVDDDVVDGHPRNSRRAFTAG